MATSRRIEVAKHLSEDQLDEAINEAQKADETRLVRRLCFVKNIHFGDTTKMAARRVGVSRHTGDRWLAKWNDESVDGLRPSFAGGRPAKLSPEQFEEFFTLLKEGQPWTPQEIDDLLWDSYGVTYDRAHLARILRADGMQYAKPRPKDPRQSPDAEADFRERLSQALTKDTDDEPLVLGFFDASWPQPFENSQRMWSYDRTVEIDKPLVTVPWKTLGFYALLGNSTLMTSTDAQIHAKEHSGAVAFFFTGLGGQLGGVERSRVEEDRRNDYASGRTVLRARISFSTFSWASRRRRQHPATSLSIGYSVSRSW